MQYTDEFDVEAETEFIVGATEYELPEEEEEEEVEESSSTSSGLSVTAAAPAHPAQPRATPLHDNVKAFVLQLQKFLKDRNVYEMYSLYDSQYNRMSERVFKTQPWPSPDAVATLIHSENNLLMLLYKELYFRHICNKLQPTLEQQLESWNNYCELFNFILNSSSDLPLELPNQWVWDIVDDFIHQYSTFCEVRMKLKNRTTEELVLLKNHSQAWSTSMVLNFLSNLVSKSTIISILEKERNASETESPAAPVGQLFKMVGYFSLIGLLKVHTLLGDYHLALKSISSLDITTKGLFTKVTASYITLYYYLGFAYMMSRRYVDAIRTFANALLYISRTKQFHNRSPQYENITRVCEKMYALLAICIAICSQRVDENVHAILREKYSEKLQKMQKGELETYEELFGFACPSFVNGSGISSIAEGNVQDPMKLQTKMFLQEVSQQLQAPVLRSYLKLYTTIKTDKLAGFLEQDEKSLKNQLLAYKHKTRGIVWTGGSPLTGETASFSDLDFFLEKDMIHIQDTKVARKYPEFFIRHSEKLLHLLDHPTTTR